MPLTPQPASISMLPEIEKSTRVTLSTIDPEITSSTSTTQVSLSNVKLTAVSQEITTEITTEHLIKAPSENSTKLSSSYAKKQLLARI